MLEKNHDQLVSISIFKWKATVLQLINMHKNLVLTFHDMKIHVALSMDQNKTIKDNQIYQGMNSMTLALLLHVMNMDGLETNTFGD